MKFIKIVKEEIKAVHYTGNKKELTEFLFDARFCGLTKSRFPAWFLHAIKRGKIVIQRDRIVVEHTDHANILKEAGYIMQDSSGKIYTKTEKEISEDSTYKIVGIKNGYFF